MPAKDEFPDSSEEFYEVKDGEQGFISDEIIMNKANAMFQKKMEEESAKKKKKEEEELAKKKKIEKNEEKTDL